MSSFAPSMPSFKSFATSTSDVSSVTGGESFFDKQGTYVLKDLNSETGTWVRIPGSFSRE